MKFLFVFLVLTFLTGCLEKQPVQPQLAGGEIKLPLPESGPTLLALNLADGLPALITVKYLDLDTVVAKTTAPSLQIHATPGSYLITLEREGFEKFQIGPFEVARGNNFVFPVKLTQIQTTVKAAELTVMSNPVGAMVYRDGYFLTFTPSVVTLPPGKYFLQWCKAGYQSDTLTVELRENDRKDVTKNLIKVTYPVGYLTVNVMPINAQVTVTDPNGKPFSVYMGFRTLELAEGSYTVIVSSPCYETQTAYPVISAGDTVKVDIVLSPLLQNVFVEGIEISPSFWTGKIGDRVSLAAIALVENAPDPAVTEQTAFSSSDQLVATVNGNEVSVRGYGYAVINGSYTDDKGKNHKDEMVVFLQKPSDTTHVELPTVPLGIELDPVAAEIEVGESETFKVMYRVLNLQTKEVEESDVTGESRFSLVDTANVATISGNNVTGVTAGKVVVKADYGKFFKSATVKVLKKDEVAPVTLEYVKLEPFLETLSTIDQTVDYKLVGYYSDKSIKELSGFDLTSSDNDYVQVADMSVKLVKFGGDEIVAVEALYYQGEEVFPADALVYVPQPQEPIIPPLKVILTANPLNIDLGQSSTLILSISGGEQPYTVTWSDTSLTTLTRIVKPEWTTTYEATIIDNSGEKVVASVTVTVKRPDQPQNITPVCKIGADVTEGQAPLTVHFNSDSCFDSDGQVVSYKWTFGDGTTSVEANPTHIFVSEGNYNVKLEVTDNTGGKAVDYKLIQVRKPVGVVTKLMVKTEPGLADIYVDNLYKGLSPLTITIDPGEYTLYISKSGYQPVDTIMTLTEGIENVFEFSLKPVALENHPPKITAFTVTPQSGEAPLTIHYAIAASDEDGDELSYEVNFGDGDGAVGKEGDYIYTQAGFYQLIAKVSDGKAEAEKDSYVSVSEQQTEQTYLSVITYPNGADLYLDNSYLGYSPVMRYETTPGSHDIKIERENYVTIDTSVTVKEGENTFEFFLKEVPSGDKMAYIKIMANVDSVHIFMDRAKYLGQTFLNEPLVVAVEPSLHFIEGWKREYESGYADIIAIAGDTVEVFLTLYKKGDGGGGELCEARCLIEVDLDNGVPNLITSDSLSITWATGQPPYTFEITGQSEKAVKGKLLIVNKQGIMESFEFNDSQVKSFYLNGFDNWYGTRCEPSPIGIIFTVEDDQGRSYSDIAVVLLPKKRLIINGPSFFGDLDDLLSLLPLN